MAVLGGEGAAETTGTGGIDVLSVLLTVLYLYIQSWASLTQSSLQNLVVGLVLVPGCLSLGILSGLVGRGLCMDSKISTELMGLAAQYSN